MTSSSLLHSPAQPYQASFHQRWGRLHHPDVRALAWLLDAPDLLDASAPEWQGRVATFGALQQETVDWLAELDAAPAAFTEYLGTKPFTRLGRYAEKLVAYYLQHTGMLAAHGIQVRGANKATIGEFDFLVHDGALLLHWEFATKLYLLDASGVGTQADYFVGPNLADTLGKKIRKIMDHQLKLSQHPDAAAYLPGPVAAAQALIKGWLFYHGQTPGTVQPNGMSAAHCRGFWLSITEFRERYVLRPDTPIAVSELPRLRWLAPACIPSDALVSADRLHTDLSTRFTTNGNPVLVAILHAEGDRAIETDRGFIVPDGWCERASEHAKRSRMAALASLGP